MPTQQITNPLSEENEGQTMGIHTLVGVYDVDETGNLNNGNVLVVELTDAAGTPFVVKKNTTTPDFTFIGVVVNAPTGGIAPGGVVEFCVEGIVQVLFDANNTTAGHLAIQSTTTAGTATDSASATVGKTIGTVLETVTISSGTALVYCHVHKM